jgi:hypothetical protein
MSRERKPYVLDGFPKLMVEFIDYPTFGYKSGQIVAMKMLFDNLRNYITLAAIVFAGRFLIHRDLVLERGAGYILAGLFVAVALGLHTQTCLLLTHFIEICLKHFFLF